MRKLIVVTLVSSLIAACASTTPASAGNFLPLLFQGMRMMPRMLQQRRPQQPMFMGQGSLPDGCMPSDIHRGGNCGDQAAQWCNTWVRLHYRLPPECFQPSLGTEGGYAGNRGGYALNGGRQQFQNGQTVTRTWHRHFEIRVMNQMPAPSGLPVPMQRQVQQATADDYAVATSSYQTLGK